MELSADVPDSTDWIPTSLPAFSPLEAALRCEVCKEFYNNPVITSCSHTFCSLCIRRCIAVDGKCPACKTACQADKLVANIAVREVVGRWVAARKSALELAKKNMDQSPEVNNKRKRGDTDANFDEDDESPVRQTRTRTTRSGRRLENKIEETPITISDDEDEEYLPAGFAKCPICNTEMKADLVYDHVATCTGVYTGGQTTRPRKDHATAFPKVMHQTRKESAPPPMRLSGLNYAMLTETALRKKLKELGIPSSGSKALLIRRHQEWINIFNSNCDAADEVRKTKRELLRELDGWERTQGANTTMKDSHIMKKDFDANGHAIAHKSQFDDLIAKARAKAKQKAVEKAAENTEEEQNIEMNQSTTQDAHITYHGAGTAACDAQAMPLAERAPQPQTQSSADNESTLSGMKCKFEEVNKLDSTLPALDQDRADTNALAAQSSQRKLPPAQIGLHNPFGNSSRKIPMFALPADPVVDVESPTTT